LAVGAQDWDRRLFDSLIPLPEGTSYNAYVVQGKDKTALIDTADPSKEREFLENLRETGVKLDYIVANHAEQDHSGLLPQVLNEHPGAKIVCSEKCKEFLMDLLPLQEGNFQVVKDGDEIALGGKTLQFIFAPWVHWPETILTYLKEDKILFPCDLFGSHLATSDLFADGDEKLLQGAKRYYAEIMMPFRAMIKKHLERIGQLDISLIAPSHGPVYSKPEFIINAYKSWTSDDVKNEVVIAYVSMHGSTEAMVGRFVDALTKRGVSVKPFNLVVSDIGELAMALVDAATVVIATPTVLSGAHPSAVYATYLANAIRPKTRFAAIIGSYGWGSNAAEQIKGMLPSLKVELLEPVMVRGYPKEEDMKSLDALAGAISEKHKLTLNKIK
jgi:flavorubredoxin